VQQQDAMTDVTGQDPEPLHEAACSSHPDETGMDLDGCQPQDEVAMILGNCLLTPASGEEMLLAPLPTSARAVILHYPSVFPIRHVSI